MIDKLVGALLGAPAEQVAEYFKEKQRLKQELKLAKLRSKVATQRAREERAKQADANDHEWELLQIQNSGWKDEFVLCVVSIPMILSFVPGTAPYVLEGFNVLEQTPHYYKLLILTIYFAIFGVRYWRRKRGEKENG